MKIFDHIKPGDVEKRELQLAMFASVSIAVLAIGTAALMYTVVFSRQAPADQNLRVAFFGYCVLCVLLAVYLWERHAMVRRLRSQIAEDHRAIVETQRKDNLELLRTMPNFRSFQDRLPMEFRRNSSTSEQLSILVIGIKFRAGVWRPAENTSALGEAAKAISRKVRQEDSIYVLGPACFGIVLPGVTVDKAQRVSGRVGEALSDASGDGYRFSYDLTIVNYPVNASTAHELQQAVCVLMSAENSIAGTADVLT
jgi:GGDEF domain-containing protein